MFGFLRRRKGSGTAVDQDAGQLDELSLQDESQIRSEHPVEATPEEDVDSSVQSLTGALELADSFLSGSSQSLKDDVLEGGREEIPQAERREATRSLLRRHRRGEASQSGTLELNPAGAPFMDEDMFEAFEAPSSHAPSTVSRTPEIGTPELPELPEIFRPQEPSEQAAPEGEKPAAAPFLEPGLAYPPVRRRVRCKSKAPRPSCIEDGACDPTLFRSFEDFEEFWVSALSEALDKAHSEGPGDRLLRRSSKRQLELDSEDVISQSLKKGLSSFMAAAKPRLGPGSKISARLHELAMQPSKSRGSASRVRKDTSPAGVTKDFPKVANRKSRN
mmetsp:Transcript_16969/g.40144  ORF Transcript_16969/g.40144 Transcript_16969/m.40144 type:complete len:332 (+) Transcript_16969:106-1101(+)